MQIYSLSPTMVISYTDCSQRFYYENCLKLPRIPNHYLAVGSAFHETLRENYFQKVQSAKDLPIDLLTDFFAEDLEFRDVDWGGDVDLSEAKDQGVGIIRGYQKDIAPMVQPIVVEQTIDMKVKGRSWSISGKVDLIDDNDLLHENKTTSRKPYKPKKDHVFQTGVYVTLLRRLWDRPNINAELIYSLRGKGTTHSFPLTFNGNTEKGVLSTFDAVADGIQKEVWIPNRYYNYCSRKYCSFWNQCEKDCGGTVAE